MCVCVCVHVCIFCIVMLEPLSIFFFCSFWDKYSISMCIMCVCLFSALSRRVGALQIAIIIILGFRAEELCESQGDRPGLPSLINLGFLGTYSNTQPVLGNGTGHMEFKAVATYAS